VEGVEVAKSERESGGRDRQAATCWGCLDCKARRRLALRF